MKITLYIRSRKPGRVEMSTRLEDEPSYDTPRVSSLAHEIHGAIDRIIDECHEKGCIEYGKHHRIKTSKQ